MPIDPGLASPLVALFARGQVPVDTRLLAASNQLAVAPVEQIALLAVLSDDPDPQVAARAWETWRSFPVTTVADVMTDADTPDRLRAWMMEHATSLGQEAPPPAAPAPSDPPAAQGAASADPPGEGEASEEGEADDEVRQLSSLPVPARVKMAMLGTREQRAVLIRDPNRVVSTAVLSSPKLNETEVENFARMTNVAGEVLRIIGTNRSWLRNYAVVAALVRNPRTPPAISIGLVPRLQERDLKTLSVDRNVPEALRVNVRKALATKASRRD